MENISENEQNISRVPEIPNTARQGFWTFLSTEQGLGDNYNCKKKVSKNCIDVKNEFFPSQKTHDIEKEIFWTSFLLKGAPEIEGYIWH